MRDRLRTTGGLGPGEDCHAALARVWTWASDPAHRPLYLLFSEVYALALRSPEDHKTFLSGVVDDWLAPLTAAYAGHPPGQAGAKAALAIAVLRGLLPDLLTTGERRRIEAALQHAAAHLTPTAQ